MQIAYKKAIAALLMCAVIVPLGRIGQTIPVMLLQIAAGAAVYFAALLLMKDRGLQEGLQMIRDKRRDY